MLCDTPVGQALVAHIDVTASAAIDWFVAVTVIFAFFAHRRGTTTLILRATRGPGTRRRREKEECTWHPLAQRRNTIYWTA